MSEPEGVPDDDDLASWQAPAELATELHVSTKTILREIARGHLVAHRIGNQWRIAPSDKAAYLAARRGSGHG